MFMTDASVAPASQNKTAPPDSGDGNAPAAASKIGRLARRPYLHGSTFVLGIAVIASLATTLMNDRRSNQSNWIGQSSTLAIPGQGRSAQQSLGAESQDESAQALTDDACRRLLVGTWKQDHLGERELVVTDDGSATMTVKIHGGWTYVLGDRLEVDIDWKIENGQLDFRTTGGRPSEKMKVLTKLWGSHRVYQIAELTEDRLLLLDEKGEMDEPWERATE
jgi:hypothetical protein